MNSINDLVAEFEALGVELSPAGEHLRFRAPQGVMTAALKQRLSTHKADILRHLSEEAGAMALIPDPTARHEPFPLTEAQGAYFLGRHGAYEFGGVSCRGYLEIAFPATLPPAAVERGWHRLIARHDMLRVVIEEEGYQRVLPKVVPPPLPVDNLTGLDEDEAARHLDHLRGEMLAAPANYTCWPLFQLRLCRCRDRLVLLLSIELILIDAASLYLLVDELASLSAGEELPAAPEVSFRDYVIAQRALQQGRRYRKDRDYWEGRLEVLPQAPDLPLARALPLPAAPDAGAFRRRAITLDAAGTVRLREVAAGLGSTVNALMLGAYAETLGTWSRSRRFTLNLPVFRREPLHPQIDQVVGDFTSVTLLEVDLDAAPDLGGRIGAIGRQLFSDLDHGSFSGLQVLGELTRRRGGPVLMPVVFTSTLGSGPAQGRRAPDHVIRRGLTQTPQVSIDCQLTELPDGLLVAWDTRDGLFPPGLVDGMFEAFRQLVLRLAAEPEECLRLPRPVSVPGAQLAVRRAANDTAQAHEDALLHGGLLDRAARHPAQPALHDDLGLVTFGEWLAEARALAAGLRAAGCKEGERVAVLCAKGRRQAFAPLAVLLCGACYVPVDMEQPAPRRAAILEDAGVRYAIADAGCELPATVVAVLPQKGEGFVSVPASPDAPAYVIYTSGSTGTPKGVVVSHAAAWNTLADINSRFGVSDGDKVLTLANLSFDLSVYDLFGVPAVGGALVFPEEGRKADPSHWAELAARHGVTVWNSVPAQLQMLCDAADGGAPVPTALRLAMVSGDWVPLDLVRRLHRHIPAARLVSLGGATEAAVWSIFHPIEAVPPHWLSIPYGRPLANQRIHVVDGALCDRPDWVAGQIAIAGNGLAHGYLNDAERTARHFVRRAAGERLYLTGDLGRCWPDGTVEFLGRLDSQVKIRGHRVELGEIASALRAHPAVGDAQVLLANGRTLCAFAETAHGLQPAVTTAVGRLHARAAAIEAEIDRDAFAALMRGADRVAMLAMAARLRADGLFSTPEQRHDLAEIYRATGVAETHRRLLRRWLDGLVDAGALSLDPNGAWHGLIAADPEAVQRAWAEVDALEQRAGYGSQTLHYVRVCADRLSGLLQGEEDVRAILFPQGEMATAHAAYRDNLVSRSMNALVVTTVRALAERRRALDPLAALRVLEVGAGVAGTATDLVPALAEFAPEYRFTDLSEFFLAEARRQFAAYSWMRYGIFDMNEDARPQGMLPNSVDVILCANVLHNARHAGSVLRRLAELLAPGGSVVFIEPFRRHNYPLLVSMEFFPELTGFTDLRAGTDQTFLTREQWLDWLREAGASVTACAPAADSVLAMAGQGVFVAQFKTDRAGTSAEALRRFLAERLPAHMVPGQIQLLDALPRLRNGKPDRAALLGWMTAEERHTAGAESPGAASRDALEQQVASVWAEVLGVDGPACDLDFYALGGDSLLLSRMIARLRQCMPEAARLEWEVLLRHVLREPTIRALATRLREPGLGRQAEAARGPALVPLWGEADGKGGCCVLVHAGTGNLLPYQHLLGVLDRTPWSRGLGIELPSRELFTGFAAEGALTRLARLYAEDLLAQGREFTLAGYCLGGLLAAEIGRILTERGATVAGLVAISAYQPPHVEAEALSDYVFARALGASPAELGLPEEPALAAAVAAIMRTSPDRIAADAFSHLGEPHHAVSEAFAAWEAQPAETRLAKLAAAGEAGDANEQQEVDRERLVEQHALFRHSMAAVGLHRPDPWLGRTLLLRNSASDPLLPGTPQDVTSYWDAICLGELIVADIPGDHFSCLSRAHAPKVAAAIARYFGGRA